MTREEWDIVFERVIANANLKDKYVNDPPKDKYPEVAIHLTDKELDFVLTTDGAEGEWLPAWKNACYHERDTRVENELLKEEVNE